MNFNLTGPTGPAGYTAFGGLTGPTGPMGLTGAMGITGSTGLTGTTGSPGTTGYTGPTGLGGNTGSLGFTGPSQVVSTSRLFYQTSSTGLSFASSTTGTVSWLLPNQNSINQFTGALGFTGSPPTIFTNIGSKERWNISGNMVGGGTGTGSRLGMTLVMNPASGGSYTAFGGGGFTNTSNLGSASFSYHQIMNTGDSFSIRALHGNPTSEVLQFFLTISHV